MCIAYDISLRKKVTVSLSVLVFALASIIILSPASAQISIPQILTVPQSVTLSVESADMSGTAFPGQWVELWQDGIIVQEDFTPFTATVDSEIQYDVFIYDDPDENKFFDHWEDGSANPTRAVILTQDTALTAFFSTGSESQNSLPVANDDDAATDEDVPVVIDVMVNDNLSGLFSVASVTEPSNGAATINADNTITYLPDQDFFGSDFFEYTVSDSTGLVQDSATVFVTINPVNDAPVAADDDITTDEDTTVSFFAEANDSDVDGDEIFVASVEQGANGSAEIASNGAVVYTPNPDFNGGDSFVYVLSDVNGATDTGTVFVTIRPVNDAPTAADDSVQTNHETPVTIPVLSNDSDPDGDTLSVTFTSTPTNGTATINVNNTIMYTPDQYFFGNDSFTYSISDSKGGSNTATVSIKVSQLEFVTTIKIKTGTTGIAANPNTNKVYVSHQTAFYGDTVTVIDGQNNEVQTEIPVKYGSVHIGVNPATNKVYVTHNTGFNPSTDRVSVIDGNTNTAKTIGIPGTSKRPFGYVAANPTTNEVFVGGFRTSSLYIINGTSDTYMNTTSITGGANRVTINPTTNMIYTGNYYSNTVSVVDGLTNKVTATIDIGETPLGIAVNPNTNKIYVGGDDIVYVINGNTNAIEEKISYTETGGLGRPIEIVVDPVTNNIYIAEWKFNRILVVDGSTDTIVEMAKLEHNPRSLTVNPESNMIYIAGFTGNITVLKGMPGNSLSVIDSATSHKDNPAQGTTF